MKRLFLTLFVSFFAVALYAQTESVQLKFKGISLDTDFNSFAQKLTEKGFKIVSVTDDGVLLNGVFMTYPNVNVLVQPNPTNKEKLYVSAMIDAGDSWEKIEKRYYEIINAYIEKYGDPFSHEEKFKGDVTSVHFNKLKSLRDGDCTYRSAWIFDSGSIVINIVCFDVKNYIICNYYNGIGFKSFLQSNVLDDI